MTKGGFIFFQVTPTKTTKKETAAPAAAKDQVT